MYTLEEIMSASLSIRLNNEVSLLDEKLTYAANWCWRYVCNFSDCRTGLKYLYTLWQAAFWHVEQNDLYFQNNTMPNEKCYSYEV